MHIVITGANGFVGSHLVKALLQNSKYSTSITRLSLIDMQFNQRLDDARIQYFEGDFSQTALTFDALKTPADIVFHLASIPGGMAEQNYELSRKVNIDATLYLLECLKNQTNTPRVIFASTIAVYGSDFPAIVDDETALKPQLTYALQKLIGEILIEDFSRRGWIDGLSIRLPGIVARPPVASGLLSAFMSNMFWTLSKAEKFVCPVSANAIAWWMSVQCCVENLIHAADLDSALLNSGKRSFVLPVLHLTMQQVIEEICKKYDLDAKQMVEYQSNQDLEKNFGAYPEIVTQRADELGFKNDVNLQGLIQHVLDNT